MDYQVISYFPKCIGVYNKKFNYHLYKEGDKNSFVILYDKDADIIIGLNTVFSEDEIMKIKAAIAVYWMNTIG